MLTTGEGWSARAGDKRRQRNLACGKPGQRAAFLLAIVTAASCLCFGSTPARALRNSPAPPPAKASIVNGSVAQPSSWPWLAGLLSTSKPTHTFCGGVVVAPTRILTAGHCVVGRSPTEITALLGRKVLSDTATGETVPVTRIALDPQFAQKEHIGAVNDVAVLTLEHAASVPVATLGSENDWGSTVMWTAGWGQTNDVSETDPSRTISDTLLSVQLRIWNDQQCASAWGAAYTAATNFCAGGDGVHAMCSGDSGGPDVVTPDSGKTWLLIGVNSKAPTLCATAGKPEIFAWVAGPALRPWIVSAMEQPPPATTPTTTPTPGHVGPTISKREAIGDLKYLVRRKTHRKPHDLSVRCNRTSASSYSCRARFLSRHRTYRGHFAVRVYEEGGASYWTGVFSGHTSAGRRVRWSI